MQSRWRYDLGIMYGKRRLYMKGEHGGGLCNQLEKERALVYVHIRKQ